MGFHTDRLGATAEIQLKNKVLVLLKPSTYMNLSGKAVRYHLNDNRLTPGPPAGSLRRTSPFPSAHCV